MRPNSNHKSATASLVSSARSRNHLAVDNMDDLLSQRSQASMSQFNGSEEGMSNRSFGTDPSMTINRRRSLGRSGSAKSSLTGFRGSVNRHQNFSSDEQTGNVGLVNHRVVNRHSAGRTYRYTDSLAEVGSSTSSISISPSAAGVLNTRRIIASPRTGQRVVFSDDKSSDGEQDDGSPTQSRSGLLACLGCFNGPRRRSNGGFERMDGAPRRDTGIVQSPGGIENSPTNSSLITDPYCRSAAKLLSTMSERLEVEALDVLDRKLVFLLHAALSGDPILTESEYTDADQWIDWIELGYSSSSLDAFERDINRHGSQGMGLIFQIFFALEYTESARLCSLVIRNVHFDPSALFGLFAVNCAKWSRDVITVALRKHDESSKSATASVPVLFSSSEKVDFKSFTAVIEWWMSRGAWGSLSGVERQFGEPTESVRNNYESFEDNNSVRSVLSSNDGSLNSRPRYRSSVGSSMSSKNSVTSPRMRVQSRLPEIDINDPEDWRLLKETLTVGSVYYTYCVVAFTKFWLEKDLISVDSDTARERLNNAYLEKEFVSKLKLSPNMPLPELVKKIEKLITRVRQLWKASGWKKNDLLGVKNTPNSSRVGLSDDDHE